MLYILTSEMKQQLHELGILSHFTDEQTDLRQFAQPTPLGAAGQAA